MIRALRNFAQDSRGFYSTELKERICDHENFPRDRHPVLFHRFDSSGPHVWIEPMKVSEGSICESKTQVYLAQTSDSAADWIDLRLSFDRVQSQTEVEVLGRILKEHDQSLGLNGVNVLKRSPNYHLVTKYGALWFQIWRRRHPLPVLPQLRLEKPAPPTPLTASLTVSDVSLDSDDGRASQDDPTLQCPSPLSVTEEAQVHLVCPVPGKRKRKNSGESHTVPSPPKRYRTRRAVRFSSSP